MRRILILLLAIAGLCVVLPASAEEVGTSAKACVIIDEASGRVLLSHNAETPLPMASTTKVMTALLALELGDLDAPVTCSRNAFGVPGTSIYLAEGETLTLREMLYGLMLASGNDAATAIAEHIGGTVEDFCRMMTARAAELGCKATCFLTPHGLPCEGHCTTAHDLALIAREAMTHPEFREIVGTTRATIPWEGREYDRVLNNKNKLLTTYEGATGIKTGYTKKAGRCLVFGAERAGMRIIGVVLNCPDWFGEAARLMDIAFDRYEAVTMMTARAAELGCKATCFLTPHGLPCEGHCTTAHDLALIAREAMTHPEFREIVGTTRATIPWEGREYDRVLNNKNKLLTTYEGATGIKTGYTKKAGRCLVFGAERAGMRIIGVVLNCPDWFGEAARLMDIAFDRYEAVTMMTAGETAATLDVAHADGSKVDAVLSADLSGVVAKGSIPQVEIDLPAALDAPIQAGQIIGTARMTAGGVVVAEVPLVAASDIARDDFPARWHMYWQNWLGTPQV